MYTVFEIKKYYQNMSVKKKAVFWSMFALFAQRGVSLITTPIFTRILTPEQFGLLSVYDSWSSVLYIFVSLNLHMGVINNAFMKSGYTKEHVVSAFQGLSLILGIVSLAIVCIFKQKISSLLGLSEFLIVLMFWEFIFKSPFYFWRAKERYKYDYKSMTKVTISQMVVTPLIMVICVLLSPDIYKGEARIIGNVISVSFFGFLFLLVNFHEDKDFYDICIWRYAFFFNLPLLPHFLSEMILNQSDRIMIDYFEGSAEVGIYSIAFSAAALIQIFFSAVNTAFIPYQYVQLKEQRYKEIARPVYKILLLAVIITLLFIVFAPEIVFLLAGNDYMGAISLVPVLSAGSFFNYMYQNFVRIELYYGKKGYTVIATLFGTCFNLFLNFMWIPKWGFIAGGYSTLICQMTMCLLHWFFYKKVEGQCLNSTQIFSKWMFLGLSAIVLIASSIMIILYHYLIVRIIVLLMSVIIAFKYRMNIAKSIDIVENITNHDLDKEEKK